MALPENPITRKETYLAKIAGQEVQIPDVPITREEAYLNQIAKEGTGTKVIANPDDVAEDVLHKVEIDGEVYSLPSGGGGSDDYLDLNNLPQVNGVELKGNKSTSDLGIKFEDLPDAPTLGTASAKNVPASGDASSSQVVMGNDSRLTDSRPASDVSSWAKQSNKPTYTASEVGLGNVPNVSTNDQTPTFTEASTRNNIASGEKLSVILGKIAKFFNDLKTVAFSGSFSDLSNKPSINSVELSGNKTASQLGMANSNTFQGTIAEWNQLTTAAKKAYDHASIPDSIDGGVTFPANKVIMTGGGNVEDAVDEVVTIHTLIPARNSISVVRGGYLKIGKMIIISAVFDITETITNPNVVIFSNLPNASTINYPLTLSEDGGTIIADDRIRVYSTNIYSGTSLTANKHYVIRGIYHSA